LRTTGTIGTTRCAISRRCTKPKAWPSPRCFGSALAYEIIEVAFHQGTNRVQREIGGHGILARRVRLEVLRARALPVLRGARGKVQHAVDDALAAVDEEGRQVVLEVLLLLVVAHDHQRIEPGIGDGARQALDVPLAGGDALCHGFRRTIDSRRGVPEKLVERHPPALAIQMVLVLLVAPRVPGHVLRRAVERRAVRAAEGGGELSHAARRSPPG